MTDYTLNEKILLCSIIKDDSGNTFFDVSTQLTAEDFQDSRNGIIYSAIFDVINNKQQISFSAIINILKNKHQEEIISNDYLNEILESYSYTTVPISDLVNEIKDRSLLNTFIKSLQDIVTSSKQQAISNISDFIGKSEENILKVTSQRRNAPVMKMEQVSTSIVNKLIDQTEKYKKFGIKPDGITGLKSGFEDLDRITRGFNESEYIIIGARPSVGKTALAIQFILNVAFSKTPVLFFSLEMDDLAIGLRMINNLSQLSLEQINSLMIKKGSKYNALISEDDRRNIDEISNLQTALIRLSTLPIILDTNPGTKIGDIESKARKQFNSSHGQIGMIVIDYLQLITCPMPGRTRNDEIQQVSGRLKQLARDLKVPIVVLSQLSRDSEKDGKGGKATREPRMSDLRDSGSIEQDADKIFILTRDDYQKAEEEDADRNKSDVSSLQLHLLKNRNGRIGKVSLIYNKVYCTFNSLYNEDDKNYF